MSLPPLPQFTDEYDGRKARYLVESLENSFRLLAQIQAEANKIPRSYSSITTTGNNNASETTLFSNIVQGQKVVGIGWQMYVKIFGTFASNANAKQLKLYINNTVIFDSTAVATNGGSWSIEAIIVDNGVSSQKNSITFFANNSATPITTTYSTSSENFNSNITISISGTGLATNDIVGQAMIITVQPI